MLSLPQVLHEAQRHSVDEIAIEREEPVTFHGEQGALILGEALSDSDISEALSQVLAPEQQAELAVAGVVEFYVEGYAEWNLVAETAEDGVVIRGRIREGDSPGEVGAPLDLPPLQPFEPERSSEIPPSSDSVFHQTGPRATRWDMGIADDVLESGTLGSSTPPPKGVPVSTRFPASGPLLLDDEAFDDEGAIDFALVGRPGTDDDELPAPALGSRPRRTPPPEPELESDMDLGMETTVAKVTTGSRPAVESTSLDAHAGIVEPGTVVYLGGIDQGEGLLRAVPGGFTVVDEDTWATVTTSSFDLLPLDHSYLVRLEDPSRCLPWLLRRLEEGARIVVEGRATTSAGARRTLLGAEATPLLAQWLDAHPQRWLCPDGSGWRLELL